MKEFNSIFALVDWLISLYPEKGVFLPNLEYIKNIDGQKFRVRFNEDIISERDTEVDLEKELNIPREVISDNKRMGLCEVKVNIEPASIPLVTLTYELLTTEPVEKEII